MKNSEKNGQAVNDLTEADIVGALEEAMREGKTPTITYVRKKFGSGSNETINKYRQKFFERLLEERVQESPECSEMFRKIWGKAIAQGKCLSEAICADLRESNTKLAAELDAILAEKERLDERLESEMEQRDTLLGQLKTAHDLLASERHARDSAVAQFTAAQQRIEDLNSRHAAEIAAERSARDACVSDSTARFEKLTREANQKETEIDGLKAKVLEMSWEKKQREQLESELNSVRAERDRILKEFADAQTAFHQASNKALRLETQLEILNSKASN